jgi:hypothetical protein
MQQSRHARASDRPSTHSPVKQQQALLNQTDLPFLSVRGGIAFLKKLLQHCSHPIKTIPAFLLFSYSIVGMSLPNAHGVGLGHRLIASSMPAAPF